MSNYRISSSDHDAACAKLVELLRLAQLEKLVAKRGLLLPIQQQVLHLDEHNKSKQIASVLVLTEGEHLMADSEIRLLLAGALGITPLRKWLPGSLEAIAFVESVGFPLLYAGKADFKPPEQVTQYLPATKMSPLLNFQKTIIDDCLKALTLQPRLLMSLPTGAGKTRCAAELVVDLSQKKDGDLNIIWLAHTEELCEQAITTMRQVCESRACQQPWYFLRIWGGHAKIKSVNKIFTFYRSVSTDQIVVCVSTPMGCLSILSSPEFSPLQAQFNRTNILIVDEAHRAAASTYRKILEILSLRNKNILVIGLSATPVRETYSSSPFEGTKDLIKIFRQIVELRPPKESGLAPIEFLISEGVLARLKIHNISVSPKIEVIAEKIASLKKRGDSTAIAFVDTIAKAKLLSLELSKQGLKADYVSSETTAPERASVIKSLRDKQLDILVNCEILTTGFDAPAIDTAFILRSTNSPVLYKQMLGRVMRGQKFGGTSYANVYLINCSFPFSEDPSSPEFGRDLWRSLAFN